MNMHLQIQCSDLIFIVCRVSYEVCMIMMSQKDHLYLSITLNTPPPSVNSSPPSAAYMRQWIGWTLVQIIACSLFSAKPLSKPMLHYCQFRANFSEILIKIKKFQERNCIWKCHLPKWLPFCPGGDKWRCGICILSGTHIMICPATR